MKEPTVALPDGSFGDAVGLGWFLRDVDGVRTVGHGGSGFGQCVALLLVPERDFAVVAAANAGPVAQIDVTGLPGCVRQRAVVGGVEPARCVHGLAELHEVHAALTLRGEEVRDVQVRTDLDPGRPAAGVDVGEQESL
ncbi:hypothetical protein ACIRPT_04320 [Streptomyces sp. NPDC101227]|uniref:hypothetical protein n=1 Tax=Streptomyces sp. NPDC101227 TaxID=3366136 RepID=UPI00381F9ED4